MAKAAHFPIIDRAAGALGAVRAGIATTTIITTTITTRMREGSG